VADEHSVDLRGRDARRGHVGAELARGGCAVVGEARVDEHELLAGVDHDLREVVHGGLHRHELAFHHLAHLLDRHVGDAGGVERAGDDAVEQRGHLEFADLEAVEARRLLAHHRSSCLRGCRQTERADGQGGGRCGQQRAA
jgi:hypothetical protein